MAIVTWNEMAILNVTINLIATHRRLFGTYKTISCLNYTTTDMFLKHYRIL